MCHGNETGLTPKLSQVTPRRKCLFTLGQVNYEQSHSVRTTLLSSGGSRAQFSNVFTFWGSRLIHLSAFRFTPPLPNTPASSLCLGQWLVQRVHGLIRPGRNALIFSPIHLILASARWRSGECSMKINLIRSGDPGWRTGYNTGERVTRNL